MNEKNFINYHILISHSPSCLNRDDMNMQKSAIFGGVRRVRISSQSLKRAIRKSPYYSDEIGHPSIRTAFLIDRLARELIDEFDSSKQDEIEKIVLYIAALIEGKSKPADIKRYKRNKKGEIKTQVLAWKKEEKNSLKRVAKDAIDYEGDGLIEFLKKEIESINDSLKNNMALDIALSGRMATGLMDSVDGALAVAHAITTHGVDADIDWFTAVDDLITDEGEVGAGHLNTQEFSSGVFYRYASLNINQLQENLGGADRGRALEIASHLLHMLATVVPSAKQKSFAAHNPADFALVSFSDIPISLANAFEKPIASQNGFLTPSIESLRNYWQTIHAGYGLVEQAAVFQLGVGEYPEGTIQCASLPDLKRWVAGNGKAKS